VTVVGQDGGQVVVGDEMQDPDDEQRHRAGQVEQVGDPGRGEDGGGVAQVRAGDGDRVEPGDDIGGVRDGDRLEVDVGHPGGGVVPVGDLVDVAGGGHPGAEVEELVDALLGAPLHGPGEEGPVGAGRAYHVRAVGHDPRDVVAVRGEVVLPTQHVIIHASRIRPFEIGTGRRELRIHLDPLAEPWSAAWPTAPHEPSVPVPAPPAASERESVTR